MSGAVRGSDGKGQVTESERHLAKIRYGCGARLLRSDTNTANVMVLAVSRVSRLNGTDVALKPEGVLQFQQVSFFFGWIIPVGMSIMCFEECRERRRHHRDPSGRGSSPTCRWQSLVCYDTEFAWSLPAKSRCNIAFSGTMR